MKLKNKVLTSAALIAATGLVGVPAALATTMTCTSSPEICISVGTTGNVVAASTTGSAYAVGSSGVFNFSVNASGLGFVVAPDILDSNTIDTTSAAAGSLQVYVTETGVTGPLGGQLLSSLTSNVLPTGWTVTGQTFFDASNSAFGQATPLSSLSLSALGTTQGLASISATGAYSLTELYTISASSSGNTNDTLDIAAAPEPGTLALFGAGLLGCALFVGRRRRSSQTRA